MTNNLDYDGAMPLKRVKVICHLCDKEWNTISDADYVTCPSCTRKTQRIKTRNDELIKGENNDK